MSLMPYDVAMSTDDGLDEADNINDTDHEIAQANRLPE